MAEPDPLSPCIVGTARRTWHPEDLGDSQAPEPLAMWEEVAREACADALEGATAGRSDLARSIESLQVVYCHSWQYDDPVARLASRIGARPGHGYYSGIGGSTPQVLLNATAERMLAGEMDLALVVGGEALATKRRLGKAGERPGWSFPPSEPRPFPWEAPFHPAELAHEVLQAWLTFAIFDSARRGHLGTPLGDHRRHLGELMASLSSVAAENPFAWFRDPRSAEEITTPSMSNRYVASPYTKLMTAIMDVDMAAGVLVSTHRLAEDLGVPRDRRVYLHGWAYAEDSPYVAERPDLWRSVAMSEAHQTALRNAGIGIDDVGHLDLYACFASSVDFARDALGIVDGDMRPLSVTGGLPYHGGPGSNPVTHAIATMVEVLRQDPGSFGLVTGVGMHMSKHSAAVYSTDPPTRMSPHGGEDLQARVDRVPGPCLLEHHQGSARVLAASAVHAHSGEPAWGLLVCEIPGDATGGAGPGLHAGEASASRVHAGEASGIHAGEASALTRGTADRGALPARCYARTFDPAMLAAMEDDGGMGLVGSTVELRTLALDDSHASASAPAGTMVNVAHLA